MSVTAEIETRSRTNVLGAPIACVTTRLPKDKPKPADDPPGDPPATNSVAKTNSISTNALTAGSGETSGTNSAKAEKKPVEVVFVVEGDHGKCCR